MNTTDITLDTGLLQCPLCDGPAYHSPATYGPGSEVEYTGCSHCQLWVRGNDTHCTIERWNNRAPDTAATAQSTAQKQVTALDHAANEWADAFYAAAQWIKNIDKGISTEAEALVNLEYCADHCQKVWADAKSLNPIQSD